MFTIRPSGSRHAVLTTLRGELRISVLDVGQGDGILIETPAGKTVLIDAGTSQSQTLAQLQKHKISQLALAVATHPHADHIGGMAAILKAIPVARFLDSGRIYSSSTYEKMLQTIQTKKVAFTKAQRGQTIEIDEVKLEVLNPGKDFIEAVGSGRSVENANSVVIRLVYGKFSMLFTGDAEFETEAQMMKAAGELSSTILKIGHHGSRHATSGKFLEMVNPEAAIISCAKDNDYGHPTAETLNRLAKIKTYRTDMSGEITITSDGNTYKIVSQDSQK